VVQDLHRGRLLRRVERRQHRLGRRVDDAEVEGVVQRRALRQQEIPVRHLLQQCVGARLAGIVDGGEVGFGGHGGEFRASVMRDRCAVRQRRGQQS